MIICGFLIETEEQYIRIVDTSGIIRMETLH